MNDYCHIGNIDETNVCGNMHLTPSDINKLAWYQHVVVQFSNCSINNDWIWWFIYIYILKLQWLHSEGWFLEMHAQPVINNFYCSTHLHLKVYIWIFMSKTHNYSFSFQHCDIIKHPFLFALVILCAYPFKWLDKLLLH